MPDVNRNTRGAPVAASAGSTASRNALSAAGPRGDDSKAVCTTASAAVACFRYRAGPASSPMTGVAPRASRRAAFSGSRTRAVT